MNIKYISYKIVIIALAISCNFNSSLEYTDSKGFICSLRKVRGITLNILVEKVKQYVISRGNPEILKVDKIIEYVSQEGGRRYEKNEVLTSLRSLIFKEEIPEYFEIVDEGTIKPTGILKQRDAVHRDGDWHLAVSILIFDKDGNLLLQKRAPTVAEPNKWEVSASGHLIAGDDYLSGAVREIEEEVGIRVDKDKLQLVKEEGWFKKIGRYDFEGIWFEDGVLKFHLSDQISKEFLSLYVYVIDNEEKEKILEFFRQGGMEDVSEVKFVNYQEELEKFRNNPDNYSSGFYHYFSLADVVREINGYLDEN